MDKYINKLIKLTKKCKKHMDVPVSAIIVKNGKVISTGYNKREKNKLTTSHAEIIAIQKANKKLKNYFLYDCDLYVTLKPCSMCEKVINSARINNVYYILEKPECKLDYNKTIYNKIDSFYEKKYKKTLHDFFNNLR